MAASVIVRQAGPALTVQDLGRRGYMAYGISAGGAADQRAIIIDKNPAHAGQRIPDDSRFNGGCLRVLPSVHTDHFAPETLARFAATTFRRGARGNRQGIPLESDRDPFSMQGQLTILSEPMLAGDIQMTGDGLPFVQLPECQTTGGYPRIATVLPDDLPKIAQAPVGSQITFAFVDHATAVSQHRSGAQRYADIKRQLQPLIRDPRTTQDLLSYQLISGAVTGWDEEAN